MLDFDRRHRIFISQQALVASALDDLSWLASRPVVLLLDLVDLKPTIMPSSVAEQHSSRGSSALCKTSPGSNGVHVLVGNTQVKF